MEWIVWRERTTSAMQRTTLPHIGETALNLITLSEQESRAKNRHERDVGPWVGCSRFFWLRSLLCEDLEHSHAEWANAQGYPTLLQ